LRLSHEKLDVYQKSIEFVAWAQSTTEKLPSKYSVRDQLDRASTSIPLNIAEGNVKASDRDRCRYLQIANGSAVECSACLDVLVARKLCTEDQVEEGKRMILEISRMLFGLQKRFNTKIIGEEGSPYGVTLMEDDDDDGR